MHRLKESFTKRKQNLLLSLLFLFFLNCFLHAQPIATVTNFSGEVKICPSGKVDWRVVKIYSPVYSNDKIKTVENSFCELIFDTGEVLRLEGNSEASIKRNGQVSIFLSMGKLLTNIDFNVYKRKKGKFEIRTLSAAASVRGTEFVVEVGTAARPVSEIAVFSGDVSVKSLDTKDEVLVPAKKQTIVEKNKPPVEPFSFTEKVIEYYETQVIAFEKRVEETRKKLDEYMEKRNKTIEDWYEKREKQIEKQFK